MIYSMSWVKTMKTVLLKNKATGEELVGAITIYGDYISFMTRFTLIDYDVLAITPNGF